MTLSVTAHANHTRKGNNRKKCPSQWNHSLYPKRTARLIKSQQLRERLGYMCNPRSLKEGTET